MKILLIVFVSVALTNCCCQRNTFPIKFKHPPCGNSISFEDLETDCGQKYIKSIKL